VLYKNHLMGLKLSDVFFAYREKLIYFTFFVLENMIK